jgi:hypothetical protein
MTTINTNSPNRSYTITGVNNDVTYKVRVAAVNSIGTGPFTEYVFATPSLFAIDNDFYNVELLLNMDQTSNSDNYFTVYETIMIFKITIIHLISLKVIVEVTFIVILLIIMTTTERNLYESDC